MLELTIKLLDKNKVTVKRTFLWPVKLSTNEIFKRPGLGRAVDISMDNGNNTNNVWNNNNNVNNNNNNWVNNIIIMLPIEMPVMTHRRKWLL